MRRWCRPNHVGCRRLGPLGQECEGWDPGEYDAFHSFHEDDERRGLGPSDFALNWEYLQESQDRKPPDVLLEARLAVHEAQDQFAEAEAALKSARARLRAVADEGSPDAILATEESSPDPLQKAILDALETVKPPNGYPGLSKNRLAKAVKVSKSKGPFEEAIDTLIEAEAAEAVKGPRGGIYYRPAARPSPVPLADPVSRPARLGPTCSLSPKGRVGTGDGTKSSEMSSHVPGTSGNRLGTGGNRSAPPRESNQKSEEAS